jgi:hypothetical protein
MFIATVVAAAVFIVMIAAIRWLAGGSADWLGSVWVAPTQPTRARGVQEDDLPPFVFRDPQPAG